MKNAILLHGLGDSPEAYWFPYIKNELEKKSYSVWAPELPEKDNPSLEVQLPYLLKEGVFTKDTIIIGHSSGASIILSVLENIKTPINKSILVSAFIERGGSRPAKIVKEVEEYDWEKVKQNAGSMVLINSDNDPWGCDDKQGRLILNRTGGTQIILHDEGHMGSTLHKQPYKKFPLLVKLIECEKEE